MGSRLVVIQMGHLISKSLQIFHQKSVIFQKIKFCWKRFLTLYTSTKYNENLYIIKEIIKEQWESTPSPHDAFGQKLGQLSHIFQNANLQKRF